jgi:hypothetical protein
MGKPLSLAALTLYRVRLFNMTQNRKNQVSVDNAETAKRFGITWPELALLHREVTLNSNMRCIDHYSQTMYRIGPKQRKNEEAA